MASNATALVVPPPPTAETNDIRDLRSPLQVAGSWLWIGWLLGFVALAVAAWLWWRRWRRKQEQAAVVLTIPPHVRARERLRAALVLLHDPRLFCIAVSDALRIYLEERFEFHAPERTTEEFLLELQETELLTHEQKEGLADFLQRCDLVKFARDEPPEMELRQLHDSALRLVDETQFERIEAPMSSLAS